MQQSTDLQNLLHSVHKKSYPAYKALKGSYQFNNYILSIDHVQGDPFASPSHISIRIPHKTAGFPKEYYKDSVTSMTLSDYLTRQFEKQIVHYTFRAKGSGKSGLISISHCGQEVLKRTACEITEKEIIARFFIGFPANGRTINATELEKILFDFLPICVQKVFLYKNTNHKELEDAIFLAEDQSCIRNQLSVRNLVAFVADGSILPRESGISSRPMKDSVPFISPESLRVTMTLPHKGEISGMGIPRGITLIVGGGYHGKSTLLNALELGVYNHISGDGREYVITDDTALKLRSEDGRFIKDVDISLFINDLPNKKDTRCFSTEDASGSTSQAAGIVEGMEAGSRVFLLDEDTSATNFMVRDTFMQEVISREKEPITPFLERAEDLYKSCRDIHNPRSRKFRSIFPHCRHDYPDGFLSSCGYLRKSQGIMWKVSSESCQSISLCLSGKSSHHEKAGSFHPLARKKRRPPGTAQNKSTWKRWIPDWKTGCRSPLRGAAD